MTRPSRYAAIEAHLEWPINGEKVVEGAVVDLDQAAGHISDPCYAIPMRLLMILTDRIGNLFSDNELDLEHRFSERCGELNSVGVFGGRFVRHPFLPPPEGPRIDDKLFRELGWEHLTTRAAVDGSLAMYREVAGPVRDRLEAYLGWLTTNPTFRAECEALRTKWAEDVRRRGSIPGWPVRQTMELQSVPAAGFPGTDPAISELQNFYDRWELLRMSTWHLPVPRGANLGAPEGVGNLMGIQDRPAVQIPSSLRLPAATPLHELARSRTGDHLAEWAAVQDQRSDGELGYSRWQKMFQLNYYRNVVLESACGDRLRRRTDLLDQVFTEFPSITGHETVRKLRLGMNRRLRGPATPAAANSTSNR